MKVETLIALLQIIAADRPSCEVRMYQFDEEYNCEISGFEYDGEVAVLR